MPVKIRLMRIGARKRPFFRVVAVDEQKKRTGAYLELLGTYNPLTNPKEIILKQDRIDDWIKKGAQPSDGYLRIIGKAPQRPPRKPKKEAKAVPAEAPAQQAKPDTAGGGVAPEALAEETPSESETALAEETTPAESDQPTAPETPEAVAETPAPESAKEAAEILGETKSDEEK